MKIGQRRNGVITPEVFVPVSTATHSKSVGATLCCLARVGSLAVRDLDSRGLFALPLLAVGLLLGPRHLRHTALVYARSWCAS